MSAFRRAVILAIGSEMLTPLRVDTNSLFITEHLNAQGIDVVFKAVVGDEREELASVLGLALTRAELVVCCGGLGPTDDDVTRDAVCQVLGLQMFEDTAITERLRARYARRFSGEMPEINRRQAMVPEGATILENQQGSAPGLWLEHEGRVVMLVPGPPREMKPMFVSAAPMLRQRAAGLVLVRRVLKIAGRVESQAEELLRPLYQRWRTRPVAIEATILAALGQLELHLSARTPERAVAERVLADAVGDVEAVFGADVFSTDGRAIEAVVGEQLRQRGWRIGVAESCTGGLITSRLTDVAGSSAYVDRSVVVYSNEAKSSLLGVPPAIIAAHGAVSEPVAVAMAEGMRQLAGVDVAVGVTGIAGPGGGSEEKPVGTVVVAAAAAGQQVVRTFRFMGERDQVKFQASQAALDMVRRMLAAG